MGGTRYAIIDRALPDEEYRSILERAKTCREDEDGAKDILGTNAYRMLLQHANRFFSATNLHLLSAVLVTTKNTSSNGVHQDRERRSAVLFLCESWHLNWGGELLLVRNDLKTIHRSVEYRPNRLAMFESGVYHVVRPPTPNTDQLRRALVLRFAEDR